MGDSESKLYVENNTPTPILEIVLDDFDVTLCNPSEVRDLFEKRKEFETALIDEGGASKEFKFKVCLPKFDFKQKLPSPAIEIAVTTVVNEWPPLTLKILYENGCEDGINYSVRMLDVPQVVYEPTSFIPSIRPLGFPVQKACVEVEQSKTIAGLKNIKKFAKLAKEQAQALGKGPGLDLPDDPEICGIGLMKLGRKGQDHVWQFEADHKDKKASFCMSQTRLLYALNVHWEMQKLARRRMKRGRFREAQRQLEASLLTAMSALNLNQTESLIRTNISQNANHLLEKTRKNEPFCTKEDSEKSYRRAQQLFAALRSDNGNGNDNESASGSQSELMKSEEAIENKISGNKYYFDGLNGLHMGNVLSATSLTTMTTSHHEDASNMADQAKMAFKTSLDFLNKSINSDPNLGYCQASTIKMLTEQYKKELYHKHVLLSDAVKNVDFRKIHENEHVEGKDLALVEIQKQIEDNISHAKLSYDVTDFVKDS